MANYKYSPLGPDEIRLLEIAPGEPGHDIHCAIIHRELTERLEFEALSYFWGPAIFDQEIYITSSRQDIGKGRKSSISTTTLAVTSALHDALHRVRSLERAVVIWADAVCINQSDIPERNAQVRLMRRIYQNCSSTLIHLGGESEESHLVPGLIEQILDAGSSNTGFSDAYDRGLMYTIEDLKLPRATNPSWRALNAIFRRPWFKRVWVMQEAALAKRVTLLCGTWSISFDDFYQAMLYNVYRIPEDDEQIEEETGAGRGCFFVIGGIRRNLQNGLRYPLLKLLHLAKEAWASNPADYLYGVLGIALEAEEPDLQPNYAEPIVETLRRYARHFVMSEETYAVLEYAHISMWVDGQPSWYQNWASHREGQIWEFALDSHANQWFQAGGTLPYHISFVKNVYWLIIKGLFVDTIDRLGEDNSKDTQVINKYHLLEGMSFNDPPLSLVQRWLREIDEMEPEFYQTPAELYEAKWQTSVTGDLTAGVHSYDICYDILMSGSLPPVSNDEPTANGLSATANYQISINDYVSNLNSKQDTLRLCRTEIGMLGRVPHGSEPGDIVVVFLGAKAPFVLRPVLDDPEGGYYVVGPCYIHGIMKGEVVAEVTSCEDEVVTDFVLK